MERSTVLNKNLKASTRNPLGARVCGHTSLNTLFSVLLILSLAGCGTLSATRIPWEAEQP